MDLAVVAPPRPARTRTARAVAPAAVALALAAGLAGCGLTDEDSPLAGLTGECRTAIHELERERGLPVDVTFAGTAGVPIRFSDAARPELRADVVLEPPEKSHLSDPSGRWAGPVDYAHSRLSTLLLGDALPATRGDVARVDLHWQRPGQTYEQMRSVLDVSTVTGAARVEGSVLVAELSTPAAWGAPAIEAGAEGIVVAVQPDAGDATASVATYATPAPGSVVVRIPVTAFTGAPPAPGTQVEVPLVVRAAYAPVEPALALVGGGEPLPDYGDRCDRERSEGPPDRHDFTRREHLDVYVVARLTATG